MDSSLLLGAFAEALTADCASRVQSGEIQDLDGVEDYLSAGIATFFDKYGSNIASQLAAYAEPAAQKAVEVVKPALQQVLSEYTPTFAAVAGGMIALSVLLGVWIAKRR